ncbi:MAG: J domain-containing protein [Haloarculaceae archaeon]
MYRTWFAIGLAGLLGGMAVVSLFAGFGSPAFLGVAAVSAAGGLLAYRYARERMLASVYAGVETGHRERAHGPPTEDVDSGSEDDSGDRSAPGETDRPGGGRSSGDRDGAAQATDGGSMAADYDDWTWTDSDPDDPFWSDDPEDWEDPWEWEATDPAEAAEGGRRWWERSGAGPEDGGSESWTGWTDEGREDRRRDRATPDERDGRPTVEAAYEILELEAGADLEAVRRAYRERAKETHPDRGGDPETFIRVREAYERLRERLEGEDR